MCKARLIVFFFLAFVLVLSCSSDDSTSPTDSGNGAATGSLKILLTDSPGEFDEVNITFSEVSVHSGDESSEEEEQPAEKAAGEWIIVNDETQTFDLLTLANGVTSVLGEKELEEGHYTQIRLVISAAEVVVSDTSYSLTVPSGTFKFVSGFDISPDESTELIVDFDAARSIHVTGKGEYKLKPTLRLINNVQCGSISGSVANYENLPVAYAIADSDTISSSYVKEDNGKFTLGFLAEGTYTVAVTDTLGQNYLNPDVSVTAGSKTDLGEITLE